MTAPDSPWSASPLSVGIEIADAGTRLSALVGDAPGGRRILERRPTPLSPDDVHVVIAEFARRALQEAGLPEAPNGNDTPAPVSLGLALRGEVNPGTGVVHSAQGMPDWAELPLGDRLSELFARVTVENATNAAALAEWALGATAGSQSAIYVAIGRHITSAYTVKGEVIHGAHDRAGQLGHWQVAASGPRCACGAEGHLDPVASAQAIVRTMIGRASDTDQSLDAILRVTNRRAEALTAAQVVRLADEGDPVAASVIGAAVEGLSAALANLITVLDPEIIVLDGPFAGEWNGLIRGIHERVLEATQGFAAPVPLVPSGLGSRAVLEGARLLAKRRAEEPRGAG